MRDKPSQTASFVAVARALANDGFTTANHFSDPFAAPLLSPGWSVARAAVARILRTSPERDKAIAQLDVIPLRVLALDAEVERAVADGCKQLVVLGAGLDTRAFRMRSLADVAVYEVDHPATQRYKRKKAAAFTRVAKSLAFVTVDFEVDSLLERLREAGHRADEPTVWLWEGVVMYLSRDAVLATLRDVAARSAAGSTVLVHYHEAVPNRPERETRVRKFFFVWWWREPQIGERDPSALQDDVRRAGFEIVSDTRPSEWAPKFGARAPVGHTAAITHLLVARK